MRRALPHHASMIASGRSSVTGLRAWILAGFVLGTVLWPGDRSALAADTGGSTGYLSVAAGGHFACGIRSDGTVACWGDNLYAQTTPPSGIFEQISAGEFHACGVRADHTIACWGFYGLQTMSAPGGNFAKVSAGYEVDCGIIATSGQIVCWNMRHGGTTTDAGSFADVSVGVNGWCSLDSAGAISCRDYGQGQAGTSPTGRFSAVSGATSYFCGVHMDRTVACWGTADEGLVQPPPPGTFTQISVGRAHACGLRSDGSAVCWGFDAHGETLAPAGVFTQVAAGDEFSCGLRENGTVACWGDNEYGQINVPHNLPSVALTLAHSLGDLAGNLVTVSVDSHNAVRREDGFVVQSVAGYAYVLTAGALLRGASRTQLSVVLGGGGARYVPDRMVSAAGAHTKGMLSLLSIRAGGFHNVRWGNSYRLVQQPSVFALLHGPTDAAHVQVNQLNLVAVGGDRHDSLGSFWLETNMDPPGLQPGDPLIAPDGSLMGVAVAVNPGGTSSAAPSNWMRPVVAALAKALQPAAAH